MPRVSVIIPVFNDDQRLMLCLTSLQHQTLEPGEFEVLVVDNGSEVPPQHVVDKFPFASLLHESKPGSYAARNRGLSVCTSPTVAFTDADCLVSPGWLEAGTTAIEESDGRVVVSGPIIIYPIDEDAPRAAELYDIAFGLDQQANQRAGFFPTANLFARREAFDEAGPFNTEVMSGGDALWCQSAVRSGYDLRLVEAVSIRHPARESVADLVRQARRFIGGRLDRGKRRNPLSLHYWRVLAKAVLPNLGAMLRARRVLTERGFGVRDWLRTLPVILLVQYGRLFELIRKRLGFSSERL